MRRLFDILFLFREYLLLALLLLASILLLASGATMQVRTVRAVTIASVGMLQDVFGFIPNYFDLRTENRTLRALNVTLSDEASRLREASLENIRLRRLLDLKERSPFTFVAANVVGKNLQLLRNTITLDVGTEDGIRAQMPIVTDAGLVGRIVAVSEGYSIGQVMLNREFRASALVQRGRVDGIVVWEGGDRVHLRNVAKTLDVIVGDVVITSSFSSVFPAGIRVGIVSAVVQTPGALFQSIEIAPTVDFHRLEEVFVITAVPDSARVALGQQNRR
jgi:rod shape-determining protein MreC